MQDNLRTFYQDNSSETVALRRQLEDLKEQLAAKDIPKPVTVDDQLSLMEKSYQLAAKYLPSGANMSGQKNSLHNANETPAVTTAPKSLNQKESFVAFTAAKKIPFLPYIVNLQTVCFSRLEHTKEHRL